MTDTDARARFIDQARDLGVSRQRVAAMADTRFGPAPAPAQTAPPPPDEYLVALRRTAAALERIADSLTPRPRSTRGRRKHRG